MIPEKQPAEMVVDQIELLNREERALMEINTSSAKDQLNDLKQRKHKLHSLCQMMGIDSGMNTQPASNEMTYMGGRTPAPSGRFGSRLINYQK